MVSNIRRAAIITKMDSSEASAAASKVARLLGESKVKVYSVLPLEVTGAAPVSQEKLKDTELDLVFAIGGDGTTLRAFRTIPSKVPLFSINSGGHRGILSEIGADSIEQAVHAILGGKYFYDSRTRIQATINGKVLPPALNDILITRVSLTRTPLVSIKLMGDEIKQRMDGIVVSTPTGSTGHSFSIGGPVLHEGMSCLILSPIASVNRMPQLVIPVEDIVVQSTYESHIIIDGQETFRVDADKPIKIFRFPDDATFLRLQKKGMRQLAKLGFSKFEF
ncbi:MAG: NAD(+)/NADH kinase [Nitrososphaera sp.]|uniref:NAD kinase n=1 Tax=Nitrososphaera gargensis (strain Ga9.2) TaxID=1237085 RepID=K0IJG7_NITGG|nr:NAD(+)/NADH kinase [Candidatus Nitrososphaera gargensis]AFU59303.1 putative inorganic polyphosphate/ATP-NAD kinase [Candidatus Nitrososphaera gargensis Ga9.2]